MERSKFLWYLNQEFIILCTYFIFPAVGRPWEDPLSSNKSTWKAIAVKGMVPLNNKLPQI